MARDVARLGAWGLALGAAAVGFLPWLPAFARQAGDIDVIYAWARPTWEERFPWQVPWSLGAMSHGANAPVVNFVGDLPATAWIGLLLGTLFAIAGCTRRRRWRDPSAAPVLLVMSVLPLLLLFLSSWLRSPTYVTGRVEPITLPFFLLLLASGLQAIPAVPQWGVRLTVVAPPVTLLRLSGGRQVARSVLVRGLAGSLSLLALGPIRRELREGDPPGNYRPWFGYLASVTSEGDVIIVNGAWRDAAEYYLPRHGRHVQLVGYPTTRDLHPSWLDPADFEPERLARDATLVAHRAARLAGESGTTVWVLPQEQPDAAQALLLAALSRAMEPVVRNPHPLWGTIPYHGFQPRSDAP
jgi:hypothetical protein